MKDSRLTTLLNFLQEDLTDAFTHYAIGLEYVSLEKSAEAISKFEEVIVLDPTYIPAYHQLGLLFLSLNRKEEGRVVLERGIEMAKKTGDTHAQMEMREALDDLS